MNNGKLLLASAFIAGTVLITVPVLKDNYSSLYQPLVETSLTHDKAAEAYGAAQWWFSLQKDETGHMNLERMMQVREQVMTEARKKKRGMASTWALTFQELGPDNVGGRTRAICFDNLNHQHMFAGGVSGGLWESTDGGSSWHHNKLWDQFDVLTITSIAQAADGSWYFGTGEALYYPLYGDGTGGFIGGGVWKSTDNGGSWNRLASTGPVSPGSPSTRWSGVGKIACDPTDGTRIYVGTYQGLMISTDAGTTFTVASPSMGAQCYDVAVASDHSVYAVIQTKLWRSNNGDVGAANWVAMGTPNNYPVAGIGRTGIAISPQDPNYVYVIASTGSGSLLGGWLTTNGSTGTPTFTQIASTNNLVFDPFGSSQQGTYDLTLAVDPYDKYHIVFGGVSLWRWDMTNNNPLSPVGQWTNIAQQFGTFGDAQYVHTDNHMILFDSKIQGRFFIGCDGGIFRSVDNGLTYLPCNKSYDVTQYYDVACDYSDPSRTMNIGGCQDNGTQYIDGVGNGPMSAVSVGGGDGGQVAYSFLNPSAGFGTVYYGTLGRSANKGTSGAPFYNNRINLLGPGTAGFANFVTPIKLWESLNDPNSQDSVLFAAQRQSESIAAGNDTIQTVNYTLKVNFNGSEEPNAAIIPSTVLVTSGSLNFNDDGLGNITGPGMGPLSTVNYSTRVMTLNFTSPVPKNTVVKVAFDVTYSAGVQLNLMSHTNSLPYQAICPSTLTSQGPNDSTYLKDIIQAKLAVGFGAAGGLFVTNKPLDFTTIPMWVKVAGTNSKPDAFGTNMVQDMCWSADGNTLYFSTTDQQLSSDLFRIDGIGMIRDTLHDDIDLKVGTSVGPNPNCHLRCTRIGSTGGLGVITSIDVDPSNVNNLIVSLAGYTNNPHVFISSNATTALSAANMTTNFSPANGNLIGMPVYACSYDKYNVNHALIGTEFGVYSTDNVTAGSVNWVSQADTASSFPRVPTLKIHQSRFEPWNSCYNAGVFYIATHGRGTWKSEVSYQPMGIKENTLGSHGTGAPVIRIFPNPMVQSGNVSFYLNHSGDVKLHIFSLKGQLVKDMVIPHLQDGPNTIEFDCSEFGAGTYILSFESGSQHGASRFIVTK